MTIERDCTGTYLSQNGLDYHVCNNEMLEDYEDGEEIKVSHKKVSDCISHGITCLLYHENEGWIEVKKIY